MFRIFFKFYCIIFFIFSDVFCNAQVLIHSHNDYTHAHPFWDAYNNKAAVIEADVYDVNNVLMVAHDKKDIQPQNTLYNMYIKPIVQLFNANKSGSNHRFYLMIDIKENTAEVLPALMKLLQQHNYVFNRKMNPNAVQVFISGERPEDTTFYNYPAYIMFDGLPGKIYSPKDLKKIVMISDDFHNYSGWNGIDTLPAADSIKISKMITEAHAEGKPVRLWGAPDTEQCWVTLIHLKADVINTDRVYDCRKFLHNLQR